MAAGMGSTDSTRAARVRSSQTPDGSIASHSAVFMVMSFQGTGCGIQVLDQLA